MKNRFFLIIIALGLNNCNPASKTDSTNSNVIDSTSIKKIHLETFHLEDSEINSNSYKVYEPDSLTQKTQNNNSH